MLGQWAENTEPGHRLVPHAPTEGTFLLGLERLHFDTQGRVGNGCCDLLRSMQLQLLHSVGVGEALTKILEEPLLLNEL